MIIITPIETLGEDTRGYTAEYEQERSGTHLCVFRKAGTVSGRHYHKGDSATKNPEVLILLNGTCTFNWRQIDENEIHTQQCSAPVRVEVPPYIWHELVHDTDCTFIEWNSVAEHAADTYRIEE